MKKTITIYPTRIEIDNYTLGDCSKLEKTLSVWNPVQFTVTFSAYEYIEEEKILIIPGGYNQSYLTYLLSNYTVEYKYKDNIQGTECNYFSLKFPTKNTLQNNAINFLLKDGIYQKFLALDTGVGKTYCSIHYAFKSKKIPITFLDQENILEQWKERILYFTTIKEEEIYIISGNNSIQKLLNMDKKELSKYKWFLGIHRTFATYILNNKEDKLIELFNKLNIGIRLYDEAHVEYKNIFQLDRLYNCISIYITATPNRSNPMEDSVYQNIFHEKYVPRFVGQQDNYHNVIISTYNTNPTEIEEASMQTKYGFDGNQWSDYIMGNSKIDIFINELKNILKFVYKKNNHKVVILLKKIDLCDYCNNELQDFITNELNKTSGSYHYKNKNKKDALTKDIIFATEKSFGKALDIENLSICINTVPCSSKTSVTQMIGRLRYIPNKEVFFIDLYDAGFKAQKKQATKRYSIYKNKAKNIYKIKQK